VVLPARALLSSVLVIQVVEDAKYLPTAIQSY